MPAVRPQRLPDGAGWLVVAQDGRSVERGTPERDGHDFIQSLATLATIRNPLGGGKQVFHHSLEWGIILLRRGRPPQLIIGQRPFDHGRAIQVVPLRLLGLLHEVQADQQAGRHGGCCWQPAIEPGCGQGLQTGPPEAGGKFRPEAGRVLLFGCGDRTAAAQRMQ